MKKKVSKFWFFHSPSYIPSRVISPLPTLHFHRAARLCTYQSITFHLLTLLSHSLKSSVLHWFELNGLDFNISKCFIITFGKGKLELPNYNCSDELLQRVSKIKDLRVVFDTFSN